MAREAAGDKYVERRFRWVNDFSTALDAAYEIGGSFAVTVDTDERIELRGEDIRAESEAATEGVLMMTPDSGTYAKERVFRLPAEVRFSGPTHESFPEPARGRARYQPPSVRGTIGVRCATTP